MSVIVKNVSKSFGRQQALNSVSFHVDSGEIAGFIGPNGAGKSTMMKIICGLISPTQGEVRINNAGISDNPVEIRSILGYLPENNPLYTDMYVEEYLLYVAGLYKIREKHSQRVKRIINLTGLTPEKHKKIGVLSKGYRQRVGLAQAIIHDPKVLILDEPTSGLDPNQIIEIRNLISELGKEKTVILSTHILQEVEAICSRVIIINKGQIVADDYTGKIKNYSITETHTVIVEFSNDPPEEIFKQLQNVEQVKKLKSSTWLIQTNNESDIRGDLFNLAVKNNLVILSLHKKDKRLEDVFRELTS
jgi:ABC-2 type transport system ATP-binding protein